MASSFHDPSSSTTNCKSGGFSSTTSPRRTTATKTRQRPFRIPKKPNSTNPQKQHYQTNFAFILTAVSLLGLAVLAVLYREDYEEPAEESKTYPLVLERRLAAAGDDDNDANNNNNNDTDDDDYSPYSCNSIYETTPAAGQAQCAFARTCNQGIGLWAPWVYCHHEHVSHQTLSILLSPVMILWLVLLFRMLGSTAEDYFSPALEMFSVKLGLPPRFAGVTLLALGNGAADVSATVSAIAGDPIAGYQLALGALTGAAMLISGVISALVVLTAEGVPCRGALVRDVTALCLAVGTVWWQLQSGQVTADSVTIFLSLYFGFVLLVLVADVYHRAVVLPRLASQARDSERQRQLDEAENLEINNHNGTRTNPSLPLPQPPQRGISAVLTAISNYDNAVVSANGSLLPENWGVESDDILAQDRPIQLHGHGGVLDRHAAHHNVVSIHQHATTALPDHNHLHHHHQTILQHNSNNNNNNMSSSNIQSTSYTALPDDDGLLLVGSDGGAGPRSFLCCVSTGVPNTSLSQAWHEGQNELQEHAYGVWDDIVHDPEVHVVSKFLLLCELPFTALRKLTVPIPCEGYYCRALIALSLGLSPWWMAYYLWNSHDIHVWHHWIYFLTIQTAVTLGALALLRYAPAGGPDGEIILLVATPIAFYGFVMAATWIDTIADALVSLLNFVGIILHIPGPVIGLTILAWGNSMGDLSANITMARKGLANMSMTACFAGPVFNILVGLGLGFSRQLASQGIVATNVSLSPSVITGFLFLLLNAACILGTGLLLNPGRIPKKFGYLSLTIYVVYVVTSIVLQYSKYGDQD